MTILLVSKKIKKQKINFSRRIIVDVFLQAVVVVGAVIIGVRFGSIGLGICGGGGLMILNQFFGLRPTGAPVDVILIILAVVIAAATMQAAGGIDFMVRIAERIIRANPKRIVFIAPLVTWFFSFLAGTANIVQALQPVIYEVSYSSRVRPERSMTVSAIAAQQSLVASPVAACTAALLGLLGSSGSNMTLGQIMMVTVPSTLMAVLITSCVMSFYGKELDDDPEYLQRLKDGLVLPPKPIEHKELPKTAAWSAIIFVLGVVFAVVAGFFPEMRTPSTGKPIALGVFLQMSMLAAAFLIMILCRPQMKKTLESSVLRAGISAIIVIFGLAWMADTFISAHKAAWIASMGQYLQNYPILFAVICFFASSFLASQAATVRAIMPIGIALGLTPATLIGVYPSVNGTSFFPASGPVISTMQFDQSGTIKIGNYVLNHSFMVPTLVATTSATLIAFVFSRIVF